MGFCVVGDAVQHVQLEVHTAKLLAEELASARGTLVAGDGLLGLAHIVEGEDDDGLTAQRDHRIRLLTHGLQGRLDGLGRDRLFGGDLVAARVARGQGCGARWHLALLQDMQQRTLNLALMIHGVGPYLRAVAQQGDLDADQSDINSEAIHGSFSDGFWVGKMYSRMPAGQAPVR